MFVEEDIELVKRMVASGLDVMPFLAEDAVWVIPGFGTYHGKQDIYEDRIFNRDVRPVG